MVTPAQLERHEAQDALSMRLPILEDTTSDDWRFRAALDYVIKLTTLEGTTTSDQLP
jgi:hypothetical protein